MARLSTSIQVSMLNGYSSVVCGGCLRRGIVALLNAVKQFQNREKSSEYQQGAL